MKKTPIRSKDSLRLGENLWWLYTPRGGYGYSYYVPAMVAKINKVKVTIAAKTKDGDWKIVRVMPNTLFYRFLNETS